MRLSSLLPIALVALSATPSIARERDNAAGEAALSRITEQRDAGKPVDCINLRDIRSSEIVPNTAIVYRMNNGTLFVNRPQGGAFLDYDDILVTRTIGTRLCRIDIVNLLDRNSRMTSGSVSLGDFVPYSKLPPRN